jgi:hypothetical protein
MRASQPATWRPVTFRALVDGAVDAEVHEEIVSLAEKLLAEALLLVFDFDRPRDG